MEINTQHNAHTISGTVHHASIELMFGSIIHQPRAQIRSPFVQIRPQDSICRYCILRLTKTKLISPHCIERRINLQLIALLITQTDSRCQQMRSTHTNIPYLFVRIAQSSIQIKSRPVDLTACKGWVTAILNISLRAIKSFRKNHRTNTHAQPSLSQFLMISILQINLFSGKQSCFIIHKA